MNNEVEKLEVKKILDNLEYVSDIHKVFIEDGYKIQEEIPSSQVKELRLNSYSAKLLSNYINNLQSKIDKANEIIKDWHQEYNGLMETNNIYISKDKPNLFDLRDVLKEEQPKETKELFEGTMDQLNDLSIFKEDK